MTARPILRWPHPMLRLVAADVEAVTDDIRSLWRDMIDTMEAMWSCRGAVPLLR